MEQLGELKSGFLDISSLSTKTADAQNGLLFTTRTDVGQAEYVMISNNDADLKIIWTFHSGEIYDLFTLPRYNSVIIKKPPSMQIFARKSSQNAQGTTASANVNFVKIDDPGSNTVYDFSNGIESSYLNRQAQVVPTNHASNPPPATDLGHAKEVMVVNGDYKTRVIWIFRAHGYDGSYMHHSVGTLKASFKIPRYGVLKLKKDPGDFIGGAGALDGGNSTEIIKTTFSKLK
jgi:hypothetical protein